MLLHIITGSAAAGLYSAALRLPQALQQLSQVTGFSLFSPLARRYGNPAKFRKFIVVMSAVAGLAGVLFAVPVWLLAPRLITVVFGKAYAPALPVLQMLSLALPFVAMTPLLSYAMMATAREVPWLRANLLTLAWNVAAGLALIATMGLKGAGLSRILAEAFLAILLLGLALRPPRGTGGVDVRIEDSDLM